MFVVVRFCFEFLDLTKVSYAHAPKLHLFDQNAVKTVIFLLFNIFFFLNVIQL